MTRAAVVDGSAQGVAVGSFCKTAAGNMTGVATGIGKPLPSGSSAGSRDSGAEGSSSPSESSYCFIKETK